MGASHICSERRPCLRFSCVFLRDEVTLDHERRITLVVVPSRCGHPFSGRLVVFIRPPSDRRNFLLLVAALLSCLSICYLTVACLLASSAATLGVLGMVFMSCGCTPAVCLATGVVTLYPFFSYTANSGSAVFLWVLFSHMVQNLHDGVTHAWSRLVLSSIGTKVWSGYYLHCWLILRDEVTLWVVLGLILDRNKEFSDFSLGGSGPSRWHHPLEGRVCCGLPHSIETGASFLFHIPSSFGMRSPCGSSVVDGSHLIATEGFPWWLGLDPSIWT